MKSHYIFAIALLIFLPSLEAGRNKDSNPRVQTTAAPLITSPTVAVKTCSDDRAPANQCFDYFTLSIFWPPGLAYRYLVNNIHVKKSLAQKENWSIHGLWPSVLSGRVTDKCHHWILKAKFNIENLKKSQTGDSYFWQSLTAAWFNIVDRRDDNNPITQFWRDEWNKHGACASRENGQFTMQKDKAYFQKALTLFSNLNIASKIPGTGLSPGSVLDNARRYAEVCDVLQRSIGKKVRVESTYSGVTKLSYLTEIQVCYDLQFQLMDCPENYRNKPINIVLLSKTSPDLVEKLKNERN